MKQFLRDMYEKQHFTCMVYMWCTLTVVISDKHTFAQWSINRNSAVLSGTKSVVTIGWTSFRDSTQKFCDTCGQIVIKVSVIHSIKVTKKPFRVKCPQNPVARAESYFPHLTNNKKFTKWRQLWRDNAVQISTMIGWKRKHKSCRRDWAAPVARTLLRH